MPLTLVRECVGCKQPKNIIVKEEELKRWLEGTLIQNAMPSLSSGEREMLISGYCDDCWKKMWREN